MIRRAAVWASSAHPSGHNLPTRIGFGCFFAACAVALLAGYFLLFWGACWLALWIVKGMP